MPKTICLADNHPDFLATWAEYLELENYRVFTASSPEEARKIILRGNVHLAIFDKRLLDDTKEDDNSGLELAKDPLLGFIPSMILTDFPTHQNVRAVLRPGESSAVDFIDKKENGPQGMLDAVAHAFETHIPIRWNLVLHFEPESGLSVPGILGMVEKDIPPHEFLWRSEELDDLLRMVFYEFNEVVILRSLWIDTGRVALLAHGHHEQADRYFAITIGCLSAIETEITHQKTFPDDPGEGGTSHVGFYRRAHYAANAWRLSGVEIDQLESLQEAADSLKENQLGTVLTKLFQGTLSAWRKQRGPQEHAGSAAEIYRKYYPLFQHKDPEGVFLERVAEVARQARRFNLVQDIAILDNSLRVQISSRQSLSFPDPCQLLFHPVVLPRNTTCYTQFSPGDLDFDTILLGSEQVTWLTDFARVAELPIWHDFASVECELRFAFLNSGNLGEIATLENQLRPSWPKIPRQGADAPAEMRKFVNCILRVREQAYDLIQQDPPQYAVCLLFNALSELLDAQQPIIRNRKDAARLVHRLVLGGYVCSDLLEDEKRGDTLDYPPLQISEDGMVRRGTTLLDLSETELRLLTVLYVHAGKPCDRKLICQEVFGIDKPGYNQLHGQIDANLNRLREKLEPDPKNPHYVITVHGRGVRLEIQPKADITSR
jgi:DNA-binding response OmpR family regulator